jgi:transposase
VAELARHFGIGWATAMTAVRDHGKPLVDDGGRLHRVRTLGIDEHKMLAAGPRHHSIFATQLVELRRGRLLDVVPGRSAKSVSTWLDERTRYWRDHVEVVAIDPHRGYHSALVSRLPRATVIIDHFHAIKLANAAIDDVRRRVQRETTGHRGRKDDPLYGARRLMTRGWERLPDHQVARLMEALRQGDIFDEVGAAIVAKELLREFYASRSPARARRRLTRFYAQPRPPGSPRSPDSLGPSSVGSLSS